MVLVTSRESLNFDVSCEYPQPLFPKPTLIRITLKKISFIQPLTYDEDVMGINESDSSEIVYLKGVPYIKGTDGSLTKMANEDYDDSLIYR